MTNLSKYFYPVIILVLVFIIFLQRCGSKPGVPKPKVILDTQYVEKIVKIRDTIPTIRPKVKSSIPFIPTPKDSSIVKKDSFKNNSDSFYLALLSQYKSTNIYDETIEIKNDSVTGKINIKDSVSENKIFGRSLSYDFDFKLREKTITKTITHTEPKRNQLYVGGGILGNPQQLVNGAEAGLLFKNKKDQIFSTKVQMTPGIGINYSLGSYWKISFRK